MRNSAGLKLGIIIFLTLLLWIPTLFISSLVYDRQQRSESVKKEIGSKWGNQQTLNGPYLTVPYAYIVSNGKGNTETNTGSAYFLPDQLTVAGNVNTIIKKRSIYKTILYDCDLTITGYFLFPEATRIDLKQENLKLNNASVNFGVSDIHGLGNDMSVMVNGKPLELQSGVATDDIVKEGFHGKLDLSGFSGDSLRFTIHGHLRGNERLFFTPLGRQTAVKITSKWKTPSFQGNFLPVTTTRTDTAFTATWNLNQLNRNYPQAWKNAQYNTENSSFGVDLIEPVGHYHKTDRTIKYALLFIGLTFVAFFIIEVMEKVRVHPINYLLTGLSLIIFYTLLLAISEHLSFGFSYLISAAALTLLIGGYSISILKNRKLGLIVGLILVVLYGFLYIIIQLEDYALLVGSIVLFLIAALIMVITRKVNWYTTFEDRE